MKKLLLFLCCFTLAFQFQSCKDDEENTEWKDSNEAAFNQIASNSAYTATTTPQGPGIIYRKVLKSGSGTKTPLYTSSVKVFYKGTYYDGTVFDAGTTISNVPATFKVTEKGSGLAIALQSMVVGDKWEVWIPWDLGYGSNGLYKNNTQIIPGYTTLVFEVELVEVYQYN